jgi:hypothetical protein
VRLVPNGTGNSRTWTLLLVSVTANGQTISVNGASPSFDAMGTAVGAATTKANAVISGIRLPGQKQPPPPKQAATPAVTPSLAGARIYVPGGSDVRFALANPTSTQTGGGAANGGGASTVGNSTGGGTPPPPPPPQPVPPQQQAAGSSTVTYENIQYTLQGCQKQAPHIICSIQITNLGATDTRLSGGQGSYYFDQLGNRVSASARSIANCAGWGWCQLPPGIAMAGKFEFTDEDGRATTLVRLQINQTGKEVARFTQVPVQ